MDGWVGLAHKQIQELIHSEISAKSALLCWEEAF